MRSIANEEEELVPLHPSTEALGDKNADDNEGSNEANYSSAKREERSSARKLGNGTRSGRNLSILLAVVGLSAIAMTCVMLAFPVANTKEGNVHQLFMRSPQLPKAPNTSDVPYKCKYDEVSSGKRRT